MDPWHETNQPARSWWRDNRRWVFFGAAGVVLLLLLVGAAASCGTSSARADGLPTTPGTYYVQEKSLSFDGERYEFLWSVTEASGSSLRRARTDDVQLRLDDKTSLEIDANREAILHLRHDVPIQVQARDRQGGYSTPWYPYGYYGTGGTTIIYDRSGPYWGDYASPARRYPPAANFDRDEILTGHVQTTSRGTPDYSTLGTSTTVRRVVPPASGTVSGQSQGTGGGNAAMNKADAAAPAISGYSGGTGSGSAAIAKSGGFAAGAQSYEQRQATTSGAGAPRISTSGGSGASTSGSGTSTSGGTGSSAAGSTGSSSPGSTSSGPAPRIGTSSGSGTTSSTGPARTSSGTTSGGSAPRINTSGGAGSTAASTSSRSSSSGRR